MKIEIDNVKNLKEMIKSCFTYGGAERGTYNFNTYIEPYSSKLSVEEFNKVYEEYLNELKENFVVQHSVYSDGEGCSYNSLIAKN